MGMKSKLKFLYRHIYAFMVLGFICFALFFSEHSVLRIWMLHRQQAQLRREISAFRDSIEQYEKHIEEVSGDAKELEKFARERLMMRRDGEDVYLIKD